MVQVYCGNLLIWADVSVADNPWLRLKGLMGKKAIGPQEGLLIRPCGQVHMLFMKFPLDIIFLSKELEVLRLLSLPPWRISPYVRGACCVIEVAAGTATAHQVKVGDKLRLVRPSKGGSL